VAVRSVYDEYQRWLASVPTGGALITAVELNWPPNNFYYMGNHINTNTFCIYENGSGVTLIPYQFECTHPERSGTTESSITLTGPQSGPIFGLFHYLRGYQTNFTITMSVRYFLWPNNLHRPLASRPERYHVTSITFSRMSISVEASMARLPRYRAGIPYTVEEYPGLAGG
jgi:hypothetical protein